LAIEVLARAYAEGYESITDLVASWQERLWKAQDRYRDDEERHATLAACFEYSYRMLPLEAKDLFPKWTIFTAPFLADVVETVFSLPEAGKLLNLLFRKSLLQRHEVAAGLDFYFFHPMGRWYAAEKAKGVDLDPFETASGAAYLEFAQNTYRNLDPLNSLTAWVMLPDLTRSLAFLPDRERSLLAFKLAWLLQIFGELEQLSRTILLLFNRRNILVRGMLGVGKSASILRLLHELDAQAKGAKDKLLPIYIYHFYGGNTEDFYRLIVLVLARILFDQDKEAQAILDAVRGWKITSSRSKEYIQPILPSDPPETHHQEVLHAR
jgi:hypothetical protein